MDMAFTVNHPCSCNFNSTPLKQDLGRLPTEGHRGLKPCLRSYQAAQSGLHCGSRLILWENALIIVGPARMPWTQSLPPGKKSRSLYSDGNTLCARSSPPRSHTSSSLNSSPHLMGCCPLLSLQLPLQEPLQQHGKGPTVMCAFLPLASIYQC